MKRFFHLLHLHLPIPLRCLLPSLPLGWGMLSSFQFLLRLFPISPQVSSSSSGFLSRGSKFSLPSFPPFSFPPLVRVQREGAICHFASPVSQPCPGEQQHSSSVPLVRAQFPTMWVRPKFRRQVSRAKVEGEFGDSCICSWPPFWGGEW